MASARALRGVLSGRLVFWCVTLRSVGWAAPSMQPVPVPLPAPAKSVSAAAPTAQSAFPMQEQREPAEAPTYEPSAPIPDGYVLRQRPKRGMVISGGVLFGAGYGLGLLGYASSEGKMDIDGGWLLLPVFGPLVAMATQRATCRVDYPGTPVCEKDGGTQLVLVNLFALQAIGATLFTLGILRTEPRLELRKPGAFRVVPAQLGHCGYGMAAVGEF